jgi:hypothetical protein
VECINVVFAKRQHSIIFQPISAPFIGYKVYRFKEKDIKREIIFPSSLLKEIENDS